MILGIGVDVCDIARWEKMAARRPGLVRKLLTEAEAALPAWSQAARFAAKEALAKALPVAPPQLQWHDAEVVMGEDGKPHFKFTDPLAGLLEFFGTTGIHLSLTHDAGVAVALVVLEGDR
ncbi:MAG: holo-ACP synthase [Propionibacteriaceae bacterium]|jgi:holo-[acyl-carrier protein] synthase|nr:holo-ACP synthase [Propionibacteriaceae bacterium]